MEVQLGWWQHGDLSRRIVFSKRTRGRWPQPWELAQHIATHLQATTSVATRTARVHAASIVIQSEWRGCRARRSDPRSPYKALKYVHISILYGTQKRVQPIHAHVQPIGRKMVFLQHQLDTLANLRREEEARRVQTENAVIRIQKHARGWQARRWTVEVRLQVARQFRVWRRAPYS
eukprot:SAG31_NODE_7458_length_1683_cov_39.134680_2_plen_176_part_00